VLGLDDWIAGLSAGASVGVVLVVAVLLGVRHATDPDHVAAMTTLVVSDREVAARSGARLGAWWGLGHALTLVLFGLPILLAGRYLSEHLQRGAETGVAAVIVFLGIRLLVRWRHGFFDLHASRDTHSHVHQVQTGLGAFGVGLVHGMGGSAGVGVLLLAAIPSETLGVVCLLVVALFTGVSMSALTASFGRCLSAGPLATRVTSVVPITGCLSVAFGAWYAAAAWGIALYPL